MMMIMMMMMKMMSLCFFPVASGALVDEKGFGLIFPGSLVPEEQDR